MPLPTLPTSAPGQGSLMARHQYVHLNYVELIASQLAVAEIGAMKRSSTEPTFVVDRMVTVEVEEDSSNFALKVVEVPSKTCKD